MVLKPAGRGPQVSGVASLFLALSTVAIVLRVYCRAFVVKSFGLDDWCALLAWGLFVAFGAFSITGVYHGTGQHFADIQPPTEFPIGLKWWWACEPAYVLANMALKVSIGVMLLRLTVQKTHRIIIWVILIVTELYGAFFFFLFVLQCRPSAYFWTKYTGGKGTCINPQITVNATYGYSAISCLGDWTFAILPMFLVWNLQMNPRTKISVALILALGAIASAATIIRIPYVQTLNNLSDFLYATSDVAIWSITETGLGITACSIATLRPLFRSFYARNKLWGGSSTKGTSKLWPSGAATSRGYIRSGKGHHEEYGLRSDLKSNQGVTTVIESGLEDLERAELKDMNRETSTRQLRNGTQWSDSEDKLTAGRSSDEGAPEWDTTGIWKTTIQKQVVS